MKTLLKKLIVPALSNKAVSSLAAPLFGCGTPVFMLHRVFDDNQRYKGISPQHLRQCLRYLKEQNYNFISLETLIESLANKVELPKKSIVFTMDDGYLDQAQVACPIFIEYECPITFFVITDLLDQSLWPWDAQVSWIVDNTDKQCISLHLEDETIQVTISDKDNRHGAREAIRNPLKEIAAENIPEIIRQLAESADLNLPAEPPGAYQPLSWDCARDLESKGIQFAPHSMSHRILSKLDRESCEQEILGSWKKLQKEMKSPLKVFCYPTGRVLDFGPREISILQQAGFIGAVATTPGYIDLKQDYKQQIFRIPRFELPDNMADFVQYCSWIEYAKR